MSGVQVHTEDPINTRTAPPSSSSATAPASVSAATTSSAVRPSSTIQPGFRAPAPSSSSSYAYAPQPTSTQAHVPAASSTTSSDGPPPPQPGALPTPRAPHSARRSASPIPPPPKAGERLQPAEFYAPQPAAAPTATAARKNVTVGVYAPTPAAYGSLEQPTRSVPPAGTTDATLSPQGPGAGLGAGTRSGAGRDAEQTRRSFEHPPGYHQDPYAGDRVPSQHGGYAPPNSSGAGLDGNETKGGILGGLSDTFNGLTGGSSGVASGAGILGGGGSGLGGEEGIMSTVGSWAKGVGKKAAELESEVWKRVNGEK